MEVAISSETSVSYHITLRRHNTKSYDLNPFKKNFMMYSYIRPKRIKIKFARNSLNIYRPVGNLINNG
jgi:hypothetical protein